MSVKLVTDLKSFNDKLVYDLQQANTTCSSMHADHIQKLNDKEKQLLALRADTTQLLEDQRLRADMTSKEFEQAHRNDQQALE